MSTLSWNSITDDTKVQKPSLQTKKKLEKYFEIDTSNNQKRSLIILNDPQKIWQSIFFISITCVSYVLHMPWRQSTLYFMSLSKKGQHQMEPKSDKCDWKDSFCETNRLDPLKSISKQHSLKPLDLMCLINVWNWINFHWCMNYWQRHKH